MSPAAVTTEGILRTLKELIRGALAALAHAYDLSRALVDLLWTASVPISAPTLLGLTVAGFLLGLLVGRLSARRGQDLVDSHARVGQDRVVLDLARLRPLGLSAEEEAESDVMDISDVQEEQMHRGNSSVDPGR
jgi:phage shock protein PspC (stress-responsive transcriptional regulator)